MALNLLYRSVFLFDLHNNPRSTKDRYLSFSDEEVLIEMKSCDLLKVTQLASIILKSPVQILAQACMLSTLPGTEPAQVMSLVKHFIDSALVSRDDMNLNVGRETEAAYFPLAQEGRVEVYIEWFIFKLIIMENFKVERKVYESPVLFNLQCYPLLTFHLLYYFQANLGYITLSINILVCVSFLKT